MLPLKELHPSCKDFSSQLQSQIEAVRAVKPRVITHLLRAATAYLNYNEMELKRETEVITEVYPSLDSTWLFEAWQSIKSTNTRNPAVLNHNLHEVILKISKKYANEPEIGEELGSLVTLESTPVYRNIEALFKQFTFLIDPRLKSLQTPSASFPEWDEYAREDLVSEILTANEYILNLLQGNEVKQRHLWRRMMRSESAHIISSFAPSPGFTPNYSETFSLDYRERIFNLMNEILVKVEPLIEKENKSIELASLQSQVEQYGMVLKRERALKDATNNLIPGDLIAVAADAQNFDVNDLLEAAECFVTDDKNKELSAEQKIAWASISEGVQNRRLEVGKAVVAQELAILTEAKIPFSPEDKAPIIGIVERSAKRLNALQIKVTVPNHARYEEKIATINPQITVDSTDSKAYVEIEIVEDKIRTGDDRLISQFYIKYSIASRPAKKLEATI